jgi:SAM-dependent methyltransferase
MTEQSRAQAAAAALARLYDVDMLEDPGDLDLYLALAARTDGPVLELAAGTGRVTVPLVLAGYDVTAVDLDPAMLSRIPRRLAGMVERAEGEVPGSGRLEPIEADLVGLELPGERRFRLALLALNSILLLDSRQAQRAAFATMARHVVPGGVTVVDAWLPSADELARYDGRLGLEYVRTDPETGLTVSKKTSAQYEPTQDVVELTAIYEEGEQGGPARRWLRSDVLRLIRPDDLCEMAEAAGLVIEALAGSYDLRPLVNHDERVILVARRRGRTRPASLI